MLALQLVREEYMGADARDRERADEALEAGTGRVVGMVQELRQGLAQLAETLAQARGRPFSRLGLCAAHS